MKNFFSSQKKVLTEMAAPRMPQGVKRKRSDTYAHTHNIHIGGQHVATISGTRAGRGEPYHAKIYTVHHNEDGMLNNIPHKDHQTHETREMRVTPRGKDGNWDHDRATTQQVHRPREYHSMEDAIHAVHATHQNNQEWGEGHDPRKRWAHAIKLSQGHDEHEKKTAEFRAAHHALSKLHKSGHIGDLLGQLQHHEDAHVAKSTKPSTDKLKQWTHDAYHYMGTTYHHTKYDSDWKTVLKAAHTTKDHPDHFDLAQQAHNVFHYGHPEGPSWQRNRT